MRVKRAGLLMAFMFLAAMPAAAADTLPPNVETLSAEEIYRLDLPQMSTLECGQCHYQVFTLLKEDGGAHQQKCRDCHETYHNFKPDVPWAKRVPSCVSCHDLPHGEQLSECLSCHKEAHAPTLAMAGETMAEQCAFCHVKVMEQVRDFPSAHADMACVDCHASVHKVSPSCADCHEDPHQPYVDNGGCVRCHPVHKPLEVRYGDTIEDSVCTHCHAAAEKDLQASQKMHASLECVLCHAEKHRARPLCEDCHGSPHPEQVHQMGTCASCHGTAHKLSINK